MLALGIFDQDVDDKLSVKFPKLYTPGLTSSFFNKQEFFRSALQGFVTSCVLFFMNYGAFFDKADSMGYSLSDYMSFGSVTATCLVIIVNAQVLLISIVKIICFRCLHKFIDNIIHIFIEYILDCTRHYLLDSFQSYNDMGKYTCLLPSSICQ